MKFIAKRRLFDRYDIDNLFVVSALQLVSDFITAHRQKELGVNMFNRPPPHVALMCATISFGLVLGGGHLMVSFMPNLNGINLIPNFLDLQFMWNRGISFSLFWQQSTFGSLALSMFMALMIITLGTYAYRTSSQLMAASLGAIIGGALGNTLDRTFNGAVLDYLVVRLGSVPLFVCNVADILISIGVLGILIDVFIAEAGGARTQHPNGPQSGN